MQGYHLLLLINSSQCSNMAPPTSPAVDLTGWERLQAFRGLHNSVRPGRTLPCCVRRYTPCNFSAHNIISNFDTDARPLLDCSDPYPCGCMQHRLPKPHSTISTPLFHYNSTPLSKTTHHAYCFAHRMSMTPQVRLIRVRSPGRQEK
jgi:hypothetical protein